MAAKKPSEKAARVGCSGGKIARPSLMARRITKRRRAEESLLEKPDVRKRDS